MSYLFCTVKMQKPQRVWNQD